MIFHCRLFSFPLSLSLPLSLSIFSFAYSYSLSIFRLCFRRKSRFEHASRETGSRMSCVSEKLWPNHFFSLRLNSLFPFLSFYEGISIIFLFLLFSNLVSLFSLLPMLQIPSPSHSFPDIYISIYIFLTVLRFFSIFLCYSLTPCWFCCSPVSLSTFYTLLLVFKRAERIRYIESR